MSTAEPAQSTRRDVKFSGSCACGGITFTCTAVPKSTTNCFCVTCRKLSGGSHQVYTNVPTDSVHFHAKPAAINTQSAMAQGDATVSGLYLSDMANRSYCRKCHTPLAMQYRNQPDRTHICVGAIEEATVEDDAVRQALMPKQNIFVSQKPLWARLVDDLPTYDRFDGDFENYIEGRPQDRA